MQDIQYAPKVRFTGVGDGGTGAAVTATIGDGVVGIVTITSWWMVDILRISHNYIF